MAGLAAAGITLAVGWFICLALARAGALYDPSAF
jgi:hypothetical protein